MKILFFSPYGQWGIHNQVDAILAKSLELRGCQAIVVLCDGLYKDCTILRDVHPQLRKRVCQSCGVAGQQMFSAFQIPQVQLRQFIRDEDRAIANQWIQQIHPQNYSKAYYEDLPLGEWVTSSIYTHFRITEKGLSRPDVQRVHRQYLVDGFLTHQAYSRILDWYQPDHIIHFNGRMAPYRIAFEVSRSRGLEVLTHERGFIDDSFSFRQNATCSEIKPVLHYTNTWQNTPIVRNELIQVRDYFYQRESGQNTNWNPFYTYQTDYSNVRHQLHIPDGAKICSLFTSSEDELALSEDYKGLTNQIQLIQQIIDIFANRQEYLVVRHHPHIGGAGNNRPETDFIVRAYQQALKIPSNVRIIMPSEQLTSYALLANTDAAIVFFSTVSIEATARGIPTAVFENSPYSNALSYHLRQDDLNPDGLNGLIERLLSPQSSITANDLKKIYRFTYTYFFRFSQKFKSFGVKNRHYFDIRIQSFDELKPGIDPTLDRICNHILQGTPLYEMPPETDDYPSEDEENRFLTEELSRIAERRASLKTQTSIQEEPPVGIIHLQPAQTSNSEFKSPAWQQVSRHRQLNSYPVAITGSIAEQLTAILALVRTIQEDYILIAHPGIQYNEAFISSAVDQLTEGNQENWQGILSGGWIQSPTGAIHHQVFTKSTLALTYRQVLNLLPELQYPFVLFSFLLMKREALLQLLESINIEHPSVPEQVFAALETLTIHKTGVPLLLVHQAEVRNTAENVNLAPSHASQDILMAYYEGIKQNPNAVELYRQVAEELVRRGNLDAARHAYQYFEKLS